MDYRFRVSRDGRVLSSYALKGIRRLSQKRYSPELMPWAVPVADSGYFTSMLNTCPPETT